MIEVKSLTILLVVILTVKLTNNAAVDPFRNKIKQTSDDVVGLYSVKEDVQILTVHNFQNELSGSKRVFFVEFYNSYCGFCQRFAPSWKEFASNVKQWKDLISVAALDCSNEDNQGLCRDFEIMGYPTLRYFHEDYAPGGQNLGLTLKAGSTAEEHKKLLLNTLVSEQWAQRGKNIPNLLPYNEPTIDDLLNHSPRDLKYSILIVQEPLSYIGQSMTLDLHETQNIELRYSYNNNTQLLTNLDIKNTPTVMVFDQKQVKEQLTITDDLKKTVVDFLRSQNIPVKDKVEMAKPDAAVLAEVDPMIENVRKMGDVVFQQDLETALRYSLRKEVSRVKLISGEKLVALKNYLNVLHKYFPFGEAGKDFLKDLKDHVAAKSPEVKGAHIYIIVTSNEHKDSYRFSTPEGWLGCKGSGPTFRGYPCGLWTLFHYLTIQHAEKNKDNPNADPKEVLNAMHGYIKNFFGCSDCSQHFQEMAKKREMEKVDSLSNSVLWLWAAHNEVNNRLSGDATEDPKFPKIQYPSKDRCHQCHQSDDSWDTTEVLKYLNYVYGALNVRYLNADIHVLGLGTDGPPTRGTAPPYFFQNIDARLLAFTTIGLILNALRTNL